MSAPKAKPSQRTKMLTAVCENCGEVLYKLPRLPWAHEDPLGPRECDMPSGAA